MPTDAQVDKALELIQKSGGNYQYFFEKLTSPAWIEPLAKRGRFSHPPAIERLGDMYRFPRWPEGDYLLRMAPLSPGAVAAAISDGCFTSDNPLVHQLLIEIGSILPGTDASRIANREKRWIDTQTSLFTLYPEKAATFVEHLCATGEAHAALNLTTSMLEVRAPVEREGTAVEGDDGSTIVWKSTPDPLGKMEPVWSGLFLRKVVEPLARALPAELLASFARNLNHAVSIHSKNPDDHSNDYSDIWRPNIEHASHPDTLSETVSALIAAIKFIVGARENGVRLVFDALEQYDWPIFNRIRAFTLLESVYYDQEVTEHFIEAPERYVRTSINPEFSSLLTKVGPTLRPEVLNRILTRIDAGPDPASYAYHLEHRVQPEEVNAVRTQIVEQWKRDWMFPLSEVLDAPRTATLKALLEKYDAPRPRFRMGGGARVIQDHSPSDVASFNTMTVPDLVQYLKDWVPPASGLPFEQPSRAGLASTLRQWVDENPERASESLNEFLTTDLDPGYITAILEAFAALAKTDRAFDVYAVARAAQWVAEDTDPLAEAIEGAGTREATWNWAQMSAARYLTDLMLQEARLDVTRAAEIWPAVKAVCYLARPTVEDEAEYKKEANRYASFALNTPRPVGVEAMIRYGRWLKLATPEERFQLDQLAPVFEVLDEKLDPHEEPSVAVREMFGMQFRTLAWLDLAWFSTAIPKLFPGRDGKTKEERTLDRFAWNTYLQYGGPVVDTVPAMRNRYLMAIRALSSSDTTVSDLDRTLASHIMQYYGHGAIELDDPMLVLFFESASVSLRAQALGDIGWNAGHEAASLDEKIQARFMSLLDSRMFLVDPGSMQDANELASFGWWLGSGKFPDQWAIERAMLILEKTRSLRPDFTVIEQLSRLCAMYPFEAVRIMRVLFEDDKDGWAIHGWGQHLDDILRAAFDDGDKARKEAGDFVEILVGRGFRGYREFAAKPKTKV
jgi:hypothetical protein